MNKKGFTLIELLAVIVLLSLIMAVSISSVVNYLNNSKDNTEKVFVEELSSIIEDYISLNTSKFNFNLDSTKSCTNTNNCKVYKATKYNDSTSITINDIINAGLITSKDLVNPINKDTTCNNTTTITVYRTSNYVYCFEMTLNCYTKNSGLINTCNFGI